ncbi:MAG TPA: hypothetical protein DCG54_03340 [Anaerolineae bacterium]|jgi:hypothetical protein|nr:hypothetical protein [Anaerolineae bacterium]
MRFSQKQLKLDARGFLGRAFFWLDSEIDVGIFYAALELRFTFEKILIKHGFASTNNSKSFEKLRWQPKELSRELNKEFAHKINLEKAFKFFIQSQVQPVVLGYYLPISQDLFSEYGKLDGFLHAQWAIPIGRPNNAWQKEKARTLRAFAEKLIPHASPENSLDFLNIPEIKMEEIAIIDAQNILTTYWKE